MSGHTPGPWQAIELLPDTSIITIDGTFEIRTPEYDVATIVPGGGPFRKKADAVLAANAPDLLETCHSALELCCVNYDTPPERWMLDILEAKCRAAIVKAEGK